MPQFSQQTAITSLHITLRPGTEAAFVDWQAAFSTTLAGFPGFISLEFLSLPEEWLVVERFYDTDSAAHWKKSVQCVKLMSELRPLIVENGVKEITQNEAELHLGVTEVIVTQVSPEKEKAFRKWSAKIHQVEAKFPGFKGVYIQSPAQSQGQNWITLLQFDTSENLDRWLNSAERQQVLKESEPLITSLESHRVVSPYAGWFASIAKTGEIPSVWKQTMAVLLVLFPVIMLEIKYLTPLTGGLNISLRTFIGNAISVSLLSFPLMPLTIYFLGWWLNPGNKWPLQKTIFGTILVVALYLSEIAFFWSFL